MTLGSVWTGFGGAEARGQASLIREPLWTSRLENEDLHQDWGVRGRGGLGKGL